MTKVRVFLLTAALVAAGAAEAGETIQANALRMAGGSQSSRFTVTLDRYSSDDERAMWREAFAAGGQEALIARWQEENPRVGTCSFSQTLGYQIRAAISAPTENGGRRIVMATDRPIAGFELMRGTHSQDFPIGWIQIEVDAEGKGEGILVGAAELVVEDGRLVVNTYGSEPVRLMGVTVRTKD